MSDDLKSLPDELKTQFLSFLREGENGQWELIDKDGLLNFVAEHGKTHPALWNLFTVNEDALVKHFEETGEVPPGVKMIAKTRINEKVTKVQILHGPTKVEKPT